jgi:hypothetical protein
MSIVTAISLLAAEQVNWVLATVNKNPITFYDVKRYNEFILKNSAGQVTNTVEEGIKSWITYYIIKSLGEKDKRYIVSEDELRDAFVPYIKMTNDQPQLAPLLLEYRDLLEMRTEMNLIIQKLTFFNEAFKRKLYQGIDENEARNFYEKNKTNFVAPPQLNLMVFAAPYPENASLTELENFEKAFEALTKEAAKTTNGQALITKYSKTIPFTPYSGTSGLTNVQALFFAGYPEEVLGLALDPTYYRQYLDKGKVFGPQLLQFRKDKKKYILVMRVLEKVNSAPLPYEQVKDYIVSILQNKKIEDTITEWCSEQIRDHSVTIEIKDKNYQGVLDAYIRR